MKRIISLSLVIVMLFSSVAVIGSAKSGNLLYHESDVEALFYDYQYVAEQVEPVLFSDSAIAYWAYAKKMEGKTKLSDWISIANKVLGEDPDKKYYTKTLVDMIALMEMDLSLQIEEQDSFDNMKDLKEYALDVADIAASFVGVEASSESLKQSIDVVSNANSFVVDTVDELKYFELIVRNYTSADNFLGAIANYSDSKPLKEAAQGLRSANQALFSKRVETMATHADIGVTFTAESFLQDLNYMILKNTNAYKTDPSVKDLVDLGEDITKGLLDALSAGGTIFKMAMLFGDAFFGTTNTFRRHNEMTAMANIAEALKKACQSVGVSLNDPAKTIHSNINLKCQYYNMLLTTHMRGEYLIYNLSQNDAGILSAVVSLLDEFKKEDNKVSTWYEGQIEIFEEKHNLVDTVLSNLYRQKQVVHQGFELHDGFITKVNRRTEVPTGYIGIYSYEDFKRIADSCPSDTRMTTMTDIRTELTTANYILMNDITFPAEYDSAAVFCGTLDGNGYTMKNVSTPIFCYIGAATIRNLALEVNYNVDLKDENSSYGAIACDLQSLYNSGGSTIDNCTVKGSVSIACRSAGVGGFLGGGGSVVLSNCYSQVDFHIKTRQGGSLGGIAGSGTAINCYNEGALYMHATCANTFDPDSIGIGIGGIFATVSWDNIENCYNTGDLTGESDLLCHVSVGGIVGESGTASKVINAYNIGQVTNRCAEEYAVSDKFGEALQPRHSAGGIVGLIKEGAQIEQCFNNGRVTGEHFNGGIVGISYSDKCDVTNCYNTGSVSGVQYAGGIVGNGYRQEVKYCFNTGSATANCCGAIAATIEKAEENIIGCYYLDNGLSATYTGATYSGAKVISAEDFKNPKVFVGFDFLRIWRLYSKDTMPGLKFYAPKTDSE